MVAATDAKHTGLTSKGQITLPKDIRVLLQFETGDKVEFCSTPDGQITVSKANKASFAKLRGLLPQPPRAHTVEEINQAVLTLDLHASRAATHRLIAA